MRKLLLALVLLAACGKDDPASPDAEITPQSPAPVELTSNENISATYVTEGGRRYMCLIHDKHEDVHDFGFWCKDLGVVQDQ